ncbi:MAG: phytanoyl-CoA dioxygenase family protein [Candidatus Latescibacteria bacterium]|nr:phytanoyl-CoA dioxygenase family protein [Candidatus Latescibacterota bacterium]
MSTAPIRLSEGQLASYHREGFAVVENLIPPEQVCALGERLREYTHGGRSADKLKIQVEPRVQRGELQVAAWGDGIRKIDGLVEGDELFNRLGLDDNIVGIIAQILGPDLKMFRNSLLLKPPKVGSQKGMHQDSPYWPIQPMALCSCWFPFDEATPENGCMGVLPSGHLRGPLPHQRVPDDFVIAEDQYSFAEMRLVPMKAGSGLFFHSLLPHYTAPNNSGQWRRAIALSYMSSHSRFAGEGEAPEYYHIQGRTFPGCVR